MKSIFIIASEMYFCYASQILVSCEFPCSIQGAGHLLPIPEQLAWCLLEHLSSLRGADRRSVIALILLDLTTAFDSINHSIVLGLLSSLALGTIILSFLKSCSQIRQFGEGMSFLWDLCYTVWSLGINNFPSAFQQLEEATKKSHLKI